MRQTRVSSILFATAAYVVVGAATAALAKSVSSPAAMKDWRLAGWLLSLIVFTTQFIVERTRHPKRVTVAIDVAFSVALGALVLAAVGPVRTHFGEPSALRLALLSLIAWPVVAGVPAFLVALLGDALLDAMTRHKATL